MKKDNEVIMDFMKEMKKDLKMDIKKIDLKVEGVKLEMKKHDSETGTIAKRLETHIAHEAKEHKSLYFMGIALVVSISHLLFLAYTTPVVG